MRRPRRRPQVEELEARTVPSAAALAHPAAVPSYTIKLHDLGPGEKGQITDRSTDVLALQVKTASGVLFLQHRTSSGDNFAYRETVFERKPGAVLPTRLQRLYQTAQKTIDGRTSTLQYQGTLVVIVRQADGYHFTVPGGSAAANEAAQTLAAEFDAPAAPADPVKLLLPSGPVQINHPWHIDPRVFLPVVGGAGLHIGAAGASASGVLTRVYRRDGHRFGTFTLTLTLPVLTLPLGPLGSAPAARGSQAVVHVTADGCIDGSADTGTVRVDMQLTASATVPAPGGKHFVVTLTGHDTEVITHQEIPPPALRVAT